MVNEDKNIALAFLVCISSVTQKPLHLIIKGDSSSGKTTIINELKKFLPEKGYYHFDALTPAALSNSDDLDFTNKIVFLGEHKGVSKSQYPIRILSSDGTS